jgi:phosphoglycolate phosphatase-like HAD superfamily hydrolase
MTAGGVLWGYGTKEELEAEQPRYLFGEPQTIAQELLSGGGLA